MTVKINRHISGRIVSWSAEGRDAALQMFVVASDISEAMLGGDVLYLTNQRREVITKALHLLQKMVVAELEPDTGETA
jgi:hypothetical protein